MSIVVRSAVVVNWGINFFIFLLESEISSRRDTYYDAIYFRSKITLLLIFFPSIETKYFLFFLNKCGNKFCSTLRKRRNYINYISRYFVKKWKNMENDRQRNNNGEQCWSSDRNCVILNRLYRTIRIQLIST